MAEKFLNSDYFKDGSSMRIGFTSALKKELLHTNEFWELLYVYEGFGELHINGKTESVKSGDIILVSPDIEFALMSPAEKNEIYARVCRCIFKREYLESFRNEYREIFDGEGFGLSEMLFSGRAFYAHIPDDDAQNVHSIMWLAAHEYNHFKTGSERIIKNAFLDMLICVTRLNEYHKNNVPPTQTTVKRLEELKKYIRSNFANDLTLELLASHTHLSREYLSRAFKAYTGQNISEYILSVRMARAKQLLRNPNRSVTEISSYCGYKTIGSFQRAFRKYTGISPSELRKQFKKK